MVGNRDQLNCDSKCTQVPVELGNIQFIIDFYALPISGTEIVLVIQWPKTLDPMLNDYSNLTMQFKWQGQDVKL